MSGRNRNNNGKSRKKRKKKGRAPAHQNKFAFRHNPKSKKTQWIMSLPNGGTCARCTKIIEWRKQYRKYKPLKRPKKCTQCQQPHITTAYHVICKSCAREKSICAKCLKPRTSAEQEEEEARKDTSMTVEEVLALLSSYNIKERQKRAIIRTMEKGELTCRELRVALEEGDELRRLVDVLDYEEAQNDKKCEVQAAAAKHDAVDNDDGDIRDSRFNDVNFWPSSMSINIDDLEEPL